MARPGSSKECKVNESELYFLIARFLEQGPCRHTAQVLKDELAEKQLLPKRKNWEGGEHQLSYEEAVQQSGHVATNHLQLLCSNHLSLLEHHGYQTTAGLHSLLGAGITAHITNDVNSWKQDDFLPRSLLHASCLHKELVVGIKKVPAANMCQLVQARHLSPDFIRPVLCGPQFYKDFKKHRTILGHLAAVFCVMFDHTGQCIITGADDDLLKVWSSHSGQLLATLRGHSAEVTDISLSIDNTMIASGSLDKTVRVWCAQTSAPIAVLAGHQSHITSVQFSPSPIEEYRYLASTGKGGFLCFWQWLPESCTFNSSPIKFMEKNRVGDQTLCSAFSPGGKYFATGGTDRIIRVYQCVPGPPTVMAEIETHTDRIMTIQFGNTGDSMFATGSCDGTAQVWRFREEGWTSMAIQIPTEELGRMSFETARSGKPDKPQVTMVGWERTDTYLTTAFSPDCVVRVYRGSDGTLLHRLQGHTGEVFVLEAHPTNSRILLTAGHDGLVIVWDILAGVQIQRFLTEHEDEGGSIPCIFDCKFSPDGLSCAAVDSTGYLTVYGFGSSQLYEQNPHDQFFHTDYRPLMRDRNHFVVDEQSQLPPHLLPPPYLVDIDGHAHPDRYQEAILRLIRPARLVKPEKASEEDEDYDEYMKKRLEQVKQQSFGFGRARVTMSARASNSRNMEVENQESCANEVSLTASGISDHESQAQTASTDTFTSTCASDVWSSSQNVLPSTESSACRADSAVTTDRTESQHVSVVEVDACISATAEAGPARTPSPSSISASCTESERVVEKPCQASVSSEAGGTTDHLATPSAPSPSSISASRTESERVVEKPCQASATSEAGGTTDHLATPSAHSPSSISASETAKPEHGAEKQHYTRAATEVHVCDSPKLTTASVPSPSTGSLPANNSEITEPQQGNVADEHSYATPEAACGSAEEEDVAMETDTQPRGSSFLSPEQQHQRMVLAVVMDGRRTPPQEGDRDGGSGAFSALEPDGELGDPSGQPGASGIGEDLQPCGEGKSSIGKSGDSASGSVRSSSSQQPPGQPGASGIGEDLQPCGEGKTSIGKSGDSASGSVQSSSSQLPPAHTQPLNSQLLADERRISLRKRSGSRTRSSPLVPSPGVLESPSIPIPVLPPPSRENGNHFQAALAPGVENNSDPRVAPAPGVENGDEPLVEVMEEEEGDSGRSIPNMLASLVYSLDMSDAEASQAISLWHSRTIIPPLDSGVLRSEQARRQQIFDEEERHYDEQIRKRDRLPLAPSPPLQVKTRHGRELRSGRTLPDPSEPTRASPSRESELSEISSVGGEESAMEEEIWEVESTASSDISDWTTEAGIKFISSERKRNKKLRKRVKSSPESSSDQEDDEEDEGVGLEAEPSSSQQRRRERPKKNEKPKKRPPIKPSVDYTVYWPPDWLKQTKPQATPYFPQVGDIIVYFRQGHELYVNAVREEKVYSSKTQMPWQKYNLLPQEMCQVKNVHYVKGPPTLCSITLVLLSATVSDDGPSTSREKPTFTFKYHDMDGVLDFLVLECVYKASIEKLLQPGERFCSLIDGTLWRGEVQKREPFSEEFSNSFWQCYHVAWDDGATDQLSPWDMEPMPQDGEEPDPNARMVALLACLTAEDPTDTWGGPEEQERERILKGLDVVEGLDEAAMFVEPVDLEEVLDYCVAVPFPTDLSTIRERLRNGFYRRNTSLLWEVVQLERNTVAYNEDDSLIVKHARVLVQTLHKFIMTPSCTDPLTCYQPEPSGEVEVDVMAPEVDFVPPVLPDTETEASRSRSPRKRRAQRLSTDSPEIPKLPPWTRKSEEFLDRMVQNKNSPPFLRPVDANEYPEYPLAISNPMDLGTVREKLLTGDYKVPNDFISDIKLIFSNAKKFNRKGSKIYKMTTELLTAFEPEVLDFLNSCQEGREVSHTYATRRSLGVLANAEDDSRSIINSVTVGTQRPMRLRSSDERLSEDGSTSVSVAVSTPTTPVSEISCVRETRSMSLILRKAQLPFETDRFSMTLRSRESRKRLLEDSDSEEGEEEEEEDEDEELPPQRSARRRPERTRRKRQRMASSNSDSGSENSVDDSPVVHTVTRKGRVVKPTSKFS